MRDHDEVAPMSPQQAQKLKGLTADVERAQGTANAYVEAIIDGAGEMPGTKLENMEVRDDEIRLWFEPEQADAE